ncbi:GTPase IMAP family member 8 isoform X2 [Salminus brasiliensis]|uniref:GTPase IMAP family member 8 isoform X2 n=1 Tax=Salminus brasiliensis TaxID=930266 RepID=UPI003B82E7D1
MDLFGQDTCAEWCGSPPDTPELRLILVGNIGCGKTLTADTLLGQSSPTGLLMPSRLCEVRRGLSEGRRLTVVETPRWYWSGANLEAGVHRESERALSLAAPGPHAFLILVPVGQFTEMERYIPAQLERVFGTGALSHTLVLLTCGDYLIGRSEEQYVRHDELQLKAMVDSCGGHWHVINNRQPQERQQVVSLLEKVERLAQSNGGCYLQSALQREVEARIQEFHRRYSLQKEEMEAYGTLAKSAQTSRMGTLGSWSREEAEDKVTSQKLANGLHAKPPQPSPRETAPGPMQKSPSFKLSKEGAILSQMSQVTEVKVNNQNNQNFINTIHHRITLSELRLVLLGQSQSGKSTAGNAILGREVFKVRGNVTGATTQQCVKGTAVIADKRLTVVDTPDWFWSSCSPKEMQAHVASCTALCSPGPHAFLLCVPLTHPGHSVLHGLGAVEAVFGPHAVQRNTLVLFTYSDLLGGAAVEKYIAEKRPEMLKLVEKCGDHHHVMERRKPGGKERGNVPELLEKVEQLVRESGGSCYSFQQNLRTKPLLKEECLDEVDRTISTTLHSLKEVEEVEEEVNNSAKPQEPSASSSSSRFGSVLRFVGEKVAVGARRVPKLTAGGALLGGAVGLFFGGPAGGAVGAAAGSVAAEVGRRKYGKSKTD